MCLLVAPAFAHEGFRAALDRASYDVQRAPDSLRIHMTRAALALRVQDHDVIAAEALWLAAKPIDRSDAAMLLGRSLAALHDDASARAWLSVAIDLDPTWPEPLIERARLTLHSDPRASAADYRRAALLSNSPDVWHECATYCSTNPTLCDAVEWFELGFLATGAVSLRYAASKVRP